MNKKYILYVLIPVLTVASAASMTGTAYAAESGNGDRINNLATKIAEKFNLAVSDVQQFFADHKASMEAQRSEKLTTTLSQAVTDGKLTQGQVNLILAKKNELDGQKASLEGMSREEARETLKTQREGLKNWAEQNNIPLKYFLGKKMKGGVGFGHR